MCRFQRLYCDSQGYVIRCHECRHYQLLFNRTVLSLNEEEYQTFLETIAARKLNLEGAAAQKETVLPTPRKGVYLLLPDEQLERLYRMVEEADTERKALSMLQLFEA